MIRLISTACLMMAAAGCMSGQRRVPSTGFIVLGPRAAAIFGMADRDSLPEVTGASVPDTVRLASTAEAARLRFTAACSRFFRHDSSYVVLLKAACALGEVTEDGEALAAFDRSGTARGSTIPSVSTQDYRVLQPGERAR